MVPDATLELTLAQFWSSLGDSSLAASVSFHGVSVDGATGAGEAGVGLTLDGAAGTRRFVVRPGEAIRGRRSRLRVLSYAGLDLDLVAIPIHACILKAPRT